MNEYKYNPIKMTPFKWFVLENFPFIEEDFDSLTSYGLWCKLKQYFDKVAKKLNEMGTQVESLTNAFIVLKDYVDNYFANLDVQEEINNKLDEMAEQGTLQEIINSYLQSNCLWVFNNVQEMKNATNLRNESKCKTLGYYLANDGGGSEYLIRTKTQNDVEDNGSIHFTNNNLAAELIVENDTINAKSFGLKGDGETDDTLNFQKLLDFAIEKNIFFPNGNYIISDNIDIETSFWFGDVNTKISIIKTVAREHTFRNKNWLDTEFSHKFSFKNIDFYLKDATINNQFHLFGFTDCSFIEFVNCNFNNNNNLENAIWFIDCYSNNKNVIFDNCNMIIKTKNDTELNTPISFREHEQDCVSENCLIKNCKIIKNGLDETLWIDGWFGKIKNVTIDNCYIEDNSNNSLTFMWLGVKGDVERPNSYATNIKLINSTLRKNNLKTNAIKLGTILDVSDDFSDNILMENCNFEILHCSQGGSLISSSTLNNYHKPIIRNCKITMLEPNNYAYGSFVRGKFISENNIYYSVPATSTSCAFYNIESSKNDKIEIPNYSAFNGLCKKINNANVVNCKRMIYSQNENINDIIIENSNINCTDYFSERLSIEVENANLILFNCDITLNDKNVIDHQYSNTITNNNVCFSNCNFNKDSIMLTNNPNAKLKVNNCSKNYMPISGIPASSETKGACVVGTIFISNTQGKSLVRKISEGNQASNWEEI